MLNVKNPDGTLIKRLALRDIGLDELVDILENLDEDEALDLGNEWREDARYDTLYRMDEDNINEALDGTSPWDIINMDVYTGYDYFTYDGYDVCGSDDIWYDIDLKTLAKELLDEEFIPRYMPSEIEEFLEEYQEAWEYLDNINPMQEKVINTIAAFKNCEADQYDLLVLLEQLARNDVFKEG